MAVNATNGVVPNGHVNGHTKVSEGFIRTAVDAANANALRLALYQITKSITLEKMKVSKQGVRGGAMQDYVLGPEDQAIVRDQAVGYLLSMHSEDSDTLSSYDISIDECSRLMSVFHGEPLDPKMIRMGYEELGFEDFPRPVTWQNQPAKEKLDDYHVVIIGAGINGIAVAIYLQRLGIPYTLIDRQSDVGGTWMENTYPDVRVDTLGFTFQYKFGKSYNWKEMFPSGPTIRNHLDEVATSYDVKKHIVFGREVIAAKWEEDLQKWELTVRLADGNTETFPTKPNAIVSACGLFSTPNLPKIPGILDFKGHMWHTTQWNHNVEWRGKDIAVIGNGSSGAQVIPRIAQEAANLGVYQRTPQWMSPYDGYRSSVPEGLTWLLENMPHFRNWNNYAGYIRSMQLAPLQVDDPEWRAKGGFVSPRNDKLRADLTNYIRKKVGADSPLFKQLLPSYAPLVRRLVVDNGFYECLNRDNVELFAKGIDRITADGIRTKDRIEKKYDIIVLACGFQPTNYLYPVEYTGRDGVTLDKTWEKDGARSYLGLTIPGYPNLFTMYGPNHQPRGGPSIHSWAEIWSRYIVSSIVSMIESSVKSMDVKQQVYDTYNTNVDAQNKKLIWENDGWGYFVNTHGRQAVNLPWTTEDYHAMIIKPDMDDYNLTR